MGRVRKTHQFQHVRILHHASWTLAAFFLATLVAPLQAAPPKRLSGDAIRNLVTGATVHMNTPVGTVIPVRFANDGTVSGVTSGMVAYYLGAARDNGRWWIKGNKLCQRWSVWFSREEKCLVLKQSGKNIQWRDRKGKTGTAILASRGKRLVAPAKRKLKKPANALGVATTPRALVSREASKSTVGKTPARSIANTKVTRRLAQAIPIPTRKPIQSNQGEPSPTGVSSWMAMKHQRPVVRGFRRARPSWNWFDRERR